MLGAAATGFLFDDGIGMSPAPHVFLKPSQRVLDDAPETLVISLICLGAPKELVIVNSIHSCLHKVRELLADTQKVSALIGNGGAGTAEAFKSGLVVSNAEFDIL